MKIEKECGSAAKKKGVPPTNNLICTPGLNIVPPTNTLIYTPGLNIDSGIDKKKIC